jgi:SOS-response transcriptional repressor LexA
VADTKKWEQTAAYYLDTHPNVTSFAKNSGLGFAVPYFHNDQDHDYAPDFLVRVADGNGVETGTLILETKGYDPLEKIKAAAAQRWVDAVNADDRYGRWWYRVIHKATDVSRVVEEIAGAALPSTPFVRVASGDVQSTVPLMSLRAAAGTFGAPDPADIEAWVVPKTSKQISEGMFVAQVIGKSMEPRIPDAAYCLFAPVPAGSRAGRILLVQHRDIADPETGGSFTVKRYESSKAGDGQSWEHREIRLLPLNPRFQPIVLRPDGDEEIRLVAEMVEVLGES